MVRITKVQRTVQEREMSATAPSFIPSIEVTVLYRITVHAHTNTHVAVAVRLYTRKKRFATRRACLVAKTRLKRFSPSSRWSLSCIFCLLYHHVTCTKHHILPLTTIYSNIPIILLSLFRSLLFDSDCRYGNSNLHRTFRARRTHFARLRFWTVDYGV